MCPNYMQGIWAQATDEFMQKSPPTTACLLVIGPYEGLNIWGRGSSNMVDITCLPPIGLGSTYLPKSVGRGSIPPLTPCPPFTTALQPSLDYGVLCH